MKYRNFGKSNIKVSEVSMGCWAIGGNKFSNSYGPVDDSQSIDAVKKALELGCNFFDTADVYGHGHSEEILGKVLGNNRKDVMIATKVGGAYMYGHDFGNMNFSQEYINFAFKQSCKRLRTDYIDVYQLHNPSLQLIEDGTVFKPLHKLKEQGKIQFVGVSIFTLEEGFAAIEHVDSIQLVFNALDPRKFELMEMAKRKGVAVIIREPLANGFLTGKYSMSSKFDESDIRFRFPPSYLEGLLEAVDIIKSSFSHRNDTLSQIALKYILSFSSVSTIIPGAKTKEQVEENMKASSIINLTDDEMSYFGS